LIGFLSPKGEFIECASWEHTCKASEICEKVFNIDLSGIIAEDYILEKGYVAIRARDAYMNYYTDNGDFRPISEEQIKWLNDNSDSLNDMQKKDIAEILEDMDARNRWTNHQLI